MELSRPALLVCPGGGPLLAVAVLVPNRTVPSLYGRLASDAVVPRAKDRVRSPVGDEVDRKMDHDDYVTLIWR